MATKLMNFRCPDYLEEKIKAFADEHDLTVSAACRNLISISLNPDETVVPAATYLSTLSSLGYEKICDIPAEDLDGVVKEFIAAGK